MPYGKQEDFNNPTLEDFEQKATPQEKKLWESYLKDYPEKFQRSILAGSDGFLFVCPTANLVVELEKFRRFSDSAGGVSGKKGDALREMGLKAAAYTYRELDTDFDGVCAAIDRAVKRQLSQESLVEIKKPTRLPLDDEEERPREGYKVTVSGEYKSEEPLGSYTKTDREESVATYSGNHNKVINPLTDDGEGYSYTRFNHREEDIAIKGNWNPITPREEIPEQEEPPKMAKKEINEALAQTLSSAAPGRRSEHTATPTDRKHIFIAKSADIVGNVALGNDTSVWYQAVLRGDEAPITVGDRSNIQDGTVVHVAHGYHTVIGSGVTIGHNCTIHGCTIEDDVLVGMGTTVLNGAKIGRNTIIGAGSLVTQNKEIPEGSLVLGSPAKVVRALTEEEIQSILNNAQEYVDLMDEEPGRSFYETAEGHIIIRN
ncbi:Carbonic anhydrase or acetyltransferase, isoleucine patch superfamily [Eubacterium aggregans]|uniref:Carbonic anhydrase or acetyltransferase, isoleucine patch superfamily n=1 Tax=Eubacterium aggregans TaxID=81409 RepID=A0A1H4AGH4_9FIRM|nr:Carbonic anhydrase or acetyltransferase, isoleucine patch superfamily [Eubacterium aggregans]